MITAAEKIRTETNKYLVRAEPRDIKVVYGLLHANASTATIPIEMLSLSEFEPIYEASSYWFYRDKDDVYAMVNLSAVDMHARKAEFGVISLIRRSGYATEACYSLFKFAFQSIGLNKLYCVVNTDNEPCLKMIEKEGTLTLDGTLRQNRFKGGKFIDQHVFSVLSSEKEKWSKESGEVIA